MRMTMIMICCCKCCGGDMEDFHDKGVRTLYNAILSKEAGKIVPNCPVCGRPGVYPENYRPAYKAAETRRKNKERQRKFIYGDSV